MRQISSLKEVSRWLVMASDLVLLNVLYLLLLHIHLVPSDSYGILCWNVAYLLAVSYFMPIAQERLARSETIIERTLITSLLITLIFIAEISVIERLSLNWWHVLQQFTATFLTLLVSRFLSRTFIKIRRRSGKDTKTVIFAGAGVNLRALYDRMTSDIATGYSIKGYFEAQDSRNLGSLLPRLGNVSELIPYLEQHPVDMLFCNLPQEQSDDIRHIMDYCENHLIHFYSVPNVRNYVHRAMAMEFVDDIPVLSVRYEPLRTPLNRVLKRTFDLVFSILFLVLIFWWVLPLVSLITWITMPGPVFFRQKRNGLYGREFTCLKFRSMRVNADADRIQATKDDPRKTKWGNIMRKTNIDELPQFINVFLGDMSIVGPRPHMVKHTEEYGALVDKYMVRHFAKPGITGWAQVTGSRGETSELWMMEERIQKDIWYVENWSLLLDIKIIIKTVTNVFWGEKGNAY